MRVLHTLLLSVSLLSTSIYAADSESASGSGAHKVKHNYESDVARLRKIVINSLYSHKEIFLRELISNANDAIEKLRLTALKDKTIWDGVNPLNITIKTETDESGKGGRIIISDTGIGMTPQELTTNLGTLAKSGTSDFLARAEGQNADGTNSGNLIGAFGLGFYSSFLVADQVLVASLPPATPANPNPVQHVFSSSADDSSFETYADPRGNTLGRGTEITLVLKEDSLEYLNTTVLAELVNKHSSFATTFPIYLFTQHTEQVPDEDDVEETVSDSPAEDKPITPAEEDIDEDAAVVEDDTETKKEEEAPPKKMKDVIVDSWDHLNSLPPIWTRDPKTVTDEEYQSFYKTTFKDGADPLAWHHFTAEAGNGVSFKAILFLPAQLSDEYWQQPLASQSKDIRLMVKRVFITSDLGEDGLPKWASWIRVVVDAEDLPLNVSREQLQSTKFLKQLKQIIIKRLIQTISRIADSDPAQFDRIQKMYGSVFKLGAVEDEKNREKLAELTRYPTNQRNTTSLNEYLENRKTGQTQIFYLAEIGKSTEDLAKSVFVEKLHARGYEVLLLGEPLDEILAQNLRKWKNVPFQDVAKAGLKFGDESSDPEDEKKQQKETEEKFKPLLKWLKLEAMDIVRDVRISNRLVTSPCAVVADTYGYTANVEKMMSASSKKDKGFMHDFAKRQKLLEINPRSPLIEGLLRRVEALPAEDEERDLEAEEELKEVASILIDGALVRSGFEVTDSNLFFSRVDRVLRRSLGVSESAEADSTVKPAPPTAPELPTEEELAENSDFPIPAADDDSKARVEVPDHLKDKVSIDIEEIDDDDNPVTPHDEL